MTDLQKIARGQRAQAAYDEFVAPIITECRNVYGERIVDIASGELNRDKRTDKLTALSTALRILDQVESGLKAAVMDGEIAQRNKLRVEDMEKMSPANRRFLNMVPH
jgi:hypothetical protein